MGHENHENSSERIALPGLFALFVDNSFEGFILENYLKNSKVAT